MSQGYTKGIPISTDPTMSANSDLVVPSQAAIVAYVNSLLSAGTVTAVTGAPPIISSGGPTPTISITQSSAIQNGYLSSTDWNTFNNKQPAGNYIVSLTGDVTATGPGAAAATIASGAVTLAKMANLAANSIIGNNTGAPATPLALTGTQVTAMLDVFTSSLKGLAPASGGGTSNFLRADGTWAAPPSGGITSLNGLTGATQTFATGTTGTNFNIVSSGTIHTFNIPDASNANRGLITNGVQTIGGNKTFSGVNTFNSGATATPVTITTTNNNNTVAALQITATSGTRAMIATSNGQAQYAARSSTHTDRELRFQLFSDGNCYFGMANLAGAGTIAPDLIIRTSADAGTNNGAIRFSLVGTNRMAITNTGIAIGSQAGALVANAYLHLMAGTAAANTAPLRFTSGTNLTTPVTGAVEYNGTNLFFTRTGTTRESVWVGNDAATAPATGAWLTPTSYYGANITNALGTPNSWASVVIGGITYKIPLYT